MEMNVSNADKKLSNRIPTEKPNELIEEQTKKIPNLFFLGLAGAAVAASAGFTFASEKKTLGNFIGLWVPTILLFGVYNKLVKVEDEIIRNRLH